MAQRFEAAGRIEPGLAVEFAALYVGLPLAMALAMPPDWLWPVFLGLTLLALALLAGTPGFRWRELGAGLAAAGRAGGGGGGGGDGGGGGAAGLAAGAGAGAGAAAAGAGACGC